MCGILGAIGPFPGSSTDLFRHALSKIAHRGPDAEGIWRCNDVVLGHRRLSIIDLSENGNQPMVDAESGLVIVFNGEIYNYLELREQLEAKGHRFVSKTDTEVLLKGYKEWGEQVLSKCNGMWALAIWNPEGHQLFLARDKFGKKPLYYALGSQGLLFASEPKALHALDVRLTEIDPDGVVEFIVNTPATHRCPDILQMNSSAISCALRAV